MDLHTQLATVRDIRNKSVARLKTARVSAEEAAELDAVVQESESIIAALLSDIEDDALSEALSVRANTSTLGRPDGSILYEAARQAETEVKTSDWKRFAQVGADQWVVNASEGLVADPELAMVIAAKYALDNTTQIKGNLELRHKAVEAFTKNVHRRLAESFTWEDDTVSVSVDSSDGYSSITVNDLSVTDDFMPDVFDTSPMVDDFDIEPEIPEGDGIVYGDEEDEVLSSREAAVLRGDIVEVSKDCQGNVLNSGDYIDLSVGDQGVVIQSAGSWPSTSEVQFFDRKDETVMVGNDCLTTISHEDKSASKWANEDGVLTSTVTAGTTTHQAQVDEDGNWMAVSYNGSTPIKVERGTGGKTAASKYLASIKTSGDRAYEAYDQMGYFCVDHKPGNAKAVSGNEFEEDWAFCEGDDTTPRHTFGI